MSAKEEQQRPVAFRRASTDVRPVLERQGRGRGCDAIARSSSLLLAAAMSALAATPAAAEPAQKDRCRAGAPTTPGDSAWCRANALVASLGTLDRKLAVVRDGFASFNLPDPIPADGPAGLRSSGMSTALPSPIGVAASFDPAIAQLHGGVIGAEARAAGKTTIYGPAVDVLRLWRSGRVAESYGEDPLLTSEMAVAAVRGIQRYKVIATLKHFAAYTQEAGRLGDSPVGTRPSVDQRVEERVLREIYYPPFESAVTRAGAGGVMCAFPRLNGTFACEDAGLLGTLKSEWGFDGAVVPDFPSAQRSVVAAINAGLDIGTFYPAAAFPGAPAVTPGGDIDLTTAVRAGRISEARLDDLLRRRLVPGFRLGVFDPPPRGKDTDDVRSAEHHKAAVRIVESGAVLLKNAQATLPIAGVRRIAVIGPEAGERPIVTEGGSANVQARSAGVAWKTIAVRAGSAVDTRYEAGIPSMGDQPAAPPSAFRTVDGRAGLLATYVNNPLRDFTAPVLIQRVEPTIAVDAGPNLPGLRADNGWSVRWAGTFTPPSGGLQRFTLAGCGSARLVIDGREVATFEHADFSARSYASVDLPAGRPVAIAVEWTPREAAPSPRMELFGTAIGTTLRLGWTPVGDGIARAAAAAAAADVALIFVAKETSEGVDQTTLSLPAEQDRLIAAVAAANPKTVVVAASGGPFAMPWLDRVAAVLDLWYPGDGFAEGATSLLFGDAAPGGRLPLTFPASEEQGPGATRQTYPGQRAANGAIDQVRFEEGLAVGYRFYRRYGQKPLFPFGFGLTYAPLALQPSRIARQGSGIRIDLAVRNDGDRADAAVVQAYITHPPASGEPAPLLAGFAKVPVGPGATALAAITIPLRAFQHWDARAHRWAASPGIYRLDVGPSSDRVTSHHVIKVASDGTMTPS